jgi:predicted DNA-binding transcriptional regulator AlpA
MSHDSGINFPTLISAKQVSSILGISQRTLWRLRASGQLPMIRFLWMTSDGEQP